MGGANRLAIAFRTDQTFRAIQAAYLNVGHISNGVTLSVDRLIASGVLPQWAITYFGQKMARGLSTGLDLHGRPETEDVYSGVGVQARKFELRAAKLLRKRRYIRIAGSEN